MISWIQKTFQQHFRSIFAAMLVVIIISFVFTIGSPGLGRAGSKELNQPFFGLNLGKQSDQQRIFGDANISVYLQAGYAALQGAQLEDYGLKRVAGLAIADQLHVPAPNSTELTAFLKGLRAFAGQDGQFDAKKYADFRDNLKLNKGLTEGDVSRVVADDYRYDKVQRLLAGPGYVLPGDVQQYLARGDTSWTLAMATVDYTSFNPDVKVSDADLAKFYEENSFRYQIPAQVRARAVEFPASQFVSQISVTEPEVRAHFDENPARYPKPAAPGADGKPAPQVTPTAGTDADFAIVRAQVEADLKLQRARSLSTKMASDLTLALYEGKVSRDALDRFLSERKLTAKPLAPFSRETGPVELGGSPELATEAFKLTEQRYFSDALETTAGSAVLFWEATLEPRTPALAEVRAKVLSDYSEEEKRKRFVDLGKTIRATIESRMKAGDTFEKAAAAAATSVKIDAKTLPAFTMRTRPQDLDYAIAGILETLQKGALSEMVISGPKGFIVYGIDKQLPEMNESSPKFIETRQQLAQSTANANANDYLQEAVEKELAKSTPVTR